MADFLHPGVYVIEQNTGARAIQGVGTSTGGFVGIAPRGPVGKAVLVTSWTDFVNKFAYGLDSPFLPNSYLAYAVYGFFNNGGTRAYVVRVADGSEKKASYTYTDGQTTPTDILKIEALDEGSWGNDLAVIITQNGEDFDLVVKFKGNQVAKYEGVSLDATKDNFIVNLVNGVDKFITVDVLNSGTIAPAELGVEKKLVGGADGTSALNPTSFTGTKGLQAFDVVDDVNLIVIPDSQAVETVVAGLAYAESRNDAFFIADGPMNATQEEIQQFREQISGKDGALYYPWIEVQDPIAKGAKKTRFVPVGGHVAGVIARIDNSRGTHKAPAGLEANIRGALSVKTPVTDAGQDILNPVGINVIRAFPNQGIVIWGARTLGSDPKDRYINVRRELKKIMKSILLGTKWAVFEPNNADLWRRLIVSVRAFLMGEYMQGAFQGPTPAESFYVKCDSENNPQSEIDAGRVNMEIGVAINKPGEFIVIRIGQWDGGASAEVA